MMKCLTYFLLFILLWLPAITCGEQYGEILPDNQYSIIGLWHFNTNSSSQMDSSGYGNTGTVIDAVYTTTGKFGGGYEFDTLPSYDDQIDVSGVGGEFNVNNGTVLCWIYRTFADDYATHAKIIEFWADYSNLLRFFFNANADVWRVNYYAEASSNIVNAAVIQAPQNTWNFMGMTWDTTASELKIYINGTVRDTTTINTTLVGTVIDVKIGNSPTGNNLPFIGIIDEVILFNRTLTAIEIRQIYAKQKGAYGIHE